MIGMTYKQRTPSATDGQLMAEVEYWGTDGCQYWLPVGFPVKFYFSGDTAHMTPDGRTWPDGAVDRIVVAGARGRKVEYRYADGTTGPT